MQTGLLTILPLDFVVAMNKKQPIVQEKSLATFVRKAFNPI